MSHPGLGIACASGCSLGGPFQGGKIASRERRRERARGSASLSRQQAPTRVRMSSPRENTQAMAICATVTLLASATVLTASTRQGFGQGSKLWKRGLEARKSSCAPLSLDRWR